MMAAILFCGITVFTSCSSSDDDNSSSPSGKSFSSVKIEYSVNAEQSTLNAFIVNVYHTKADANTDPEAMTGTTWTKTVEIPASRVPCTVQFYTIIKPQDNDGKASNLTYSVNKSIKINVVKTDGTSIGSEKNQDSMSPLNVEDGMSLTQFAKETNSKIERWTYYIDENGTITKK